MRRALAYAVALAATACSSRPAVPEGPPPEYERSPVMPWDAGKAAEDDPFGHAAEGEWVDEAEDAASREPARDSRRDAGPPLSSDGGVG